VNFRDLADVLHDCSNVFVAVVVETFLDDTCEFAGYRICGKQYAWLERLDAKTIFGSNKVVFDERRIAVIERGMLRFRGC
jgi:hypothetical protein